MNIIFKALSAAALAMTATAGQAATNTYYGNANQPVFEALLDTTFTYMDLTTYATGTTTTTLSGLFPDADFFDLPVSSVRNDNLLPNGSGFHGTTNPHIGMNFAGGVNGVGVYANSFDGGNILAYTGLNGTGTLLGSAAYGNVAGNPAFNFGAITSDTLIKSVIFTCEFNFDLACGVIDPQWGTGSSFAAPVPLPASGLLLLAGVGAAAALRKRRG